MRLCQRQAGALAARDPDKPRLELCLRAWVGWRAARRRAGSAGKGVRWEVRGTARAKARRKNESAARGGWHGDSPDWRGARLRGDGGRDDWTARVGPDLEGFECPAEEHSAQLPTGDFRSGLNYLEGG